MALNIKKVRRQRKALEMICAMLEITDRKLDNFIKTEELPKSAMKVGTKAKK